MVTASRGRKAGPPGREFRVGEKFDVLSSERRRVFRAHSSKHNPGYFGPDIPVWMAGSKVGTVTPETRFRAYSMIRRGEPALRIADVCKVRKATIAGWIRDAVVNRALPESALEHPLMFEFPDEREKALEVLVRPSSPASEGASVRRNVGTAFADGLDPATADFVLALALDAGRSSDEIAGYIGVPTGPVEDFLRASRRSAPTRGPAGDAPSVSASMSEVIAWLRCRDASTVLAWATRTGKSRPAPVVARRLESAPRFLQDEIDDGRRAVPGSDPEARATVEGRVEMPNAVVERRDDRPLVAKVTTSAGFSLEVSMPRSLVEANVVGDLRRLLGSSPWEGDVRFVFGDREAWRRLGDLAVEASGPRVESRDVVTLRGAGT